MTDTLTMAELERLEMVPLTGDALSCNRPQMQTAIPEPLWRKVLAAARREVERRELPAHLKAQHWEQIPCGACDGRGWFRGQGYGIQRYPEQSP